MSRMSERSAIRIGSAALGFAFLMIGAPVGAQQASTPPTAQPERESVAPGDNAAPRHADSPLPTEVPRAARATALSGAVRDSVAGTPVAGARIELLGTRYYAYARPDGSFAMGDIPHGIYTVRVLRLGYEPVSLPSLRIPEDVVDGKLELFMHRAMLALSEIVVTPGYFGLLKPSLATPQALSREQLQTIPQIGEDIYRAVARLPGVSADDFSAKFNVRGGSGDELYVTLDGLELVEPFHLRDVGGAFSIVDIQSLGTASLTTGGFSAEYGDRLTGVFSLQTSDPQTDRMRTSLGLSVMNARLTSQGGFAGGRGGWLVSMRPGYLDVALKLTSVSDSIRPRYYDLFAKAQYDLGRGGRVAMHVLRASDTFRYLLKEDPNIASSPGMTASAHASASPPCSPPECSTGVAMEMRAGAVFRRRSSPTTGRWIVSACDRTGRSTSRRA